MHHDLRRPQRIGDARLDLVGNLVGVGDARGPGHTNRHFGEHDARCPGSRPDATHLGNTRDLLDQSANVGRVEPALVDEDGDRFFEDLVAIQGDDYRHRECQDRIERSKAEFRQGQRCDGQDGDIEIAVRMGSIGDQERARQLATSTALIDDDVRVDDQCQPDQRDLQERRRLGGMGAPELNDAFTQQLEARDREERHDGQGAERLELGVAIWVGLVGRSSRHAHDNHPDDVVEQVVGRLERRTEHRERLGSNTDDYLDRHDDQVEHEDPREHLAHSIRAPIWRDAGAADRSRSHALSGARVGHVVSFTGSSDQVNAAIAELATPGVLAPFRVWYERGEMPELPEVEYASRVLRKAVVGRTVRDIKVLHPAQRRGLPPRDVARVRGTVITGVERRGKHQLLALSSGDTLVVHFRMTGDWLVGTSDTDAPKFARVAIDLDDGRRISLVDPRALSTATLHRSGESLPVLGPDAADPSVSVEVFGAALARRRVPIKVALLDQRVLAGVGNIYAAEALWLARIDPRAVASSLAKARQRRLLEAVRSVLSKAQRSTGRYRNDGVGRFEVYDREGEPCSRCGTSIARIVQGARSTYFCPHCQRR